MKRPRESDGEEALGDWEYCTVLEQGQEKIVLRPAAVEAMKGARQLAEDYAARGKNVVFDVGLEEDTRIKGVRLDENRHFQVKQGKTRMLISWSDYCYILRKNSSGFRWGGVNVRGSATEKWSENTSV